MEAEVEAGKAEDLEEEIQGNHPCTEQPVMTAEIRVKSRSNRPVTDLCFAAIASKKKVVRVQEDRTIEITGIETSTEIQGPQCSKQHAMNAGMYVKSRLDQVEINLFFAVIVSRKEAKQEEVKPGISRKILRY